MKMNKLYMALAAAALGLSSNAMALTFTDGNFTGSVDFSGTITVPVAVNHWQWAAGDAISFASHPVTQMSNGYKTLTLPATSNLPLLVGQTKAATVGNAGATSGLNPQIAFTDAAGTAVPPVWDNTGNTGKGTITLPVTAADGTTVLGSMSMRVTVGAIRVSQVGSDSFLNSYYAKTGLALYGSSALPSPSGVITSGIAAGGWNALLGAVSVTELHNQLNTASGQTGTAWVADVSRDAEGFVDPGVYFSGTYGLGIAQNDNIIVNFTNAVTTNTTWKAPLKMMVTYL